MVQVGHVGSVAQPLTAIRDGQSARPGFKVSAKAAVADDNQAEVRGFRAQTGHRVEEEIEALLSLETPDGADDEIGVRAAECLPNAGAASLNPAKGTGVDRIEQNVDPIGTGAMPDQRVLDLG
jgi:hypothetical protein